MADGNTHPIVPAAPRVFAAIAAVMTDLSKEGIGKDNKNTQQNYRFRGIDDVYNALAPVLARHRLIVLPRCVARGCEERETKQGGRLAYVTVEAEFDLVSAEDGSKVTARTFGEAMDSADKATNKAMSAAYKYMAMQTFCIPTEGDNDADGTTHDVRSRAEGRDPPDAEDVRACFLEIDRASDLLAWGKANASRIEKLTERGQTAVREHYRRKLSSPPKQQPASREAEEVFA